MTLAPPTRSALQITLPTALNEVRVLQCPPGMGKSVLSREAIRDAFRQDTLHRVIFAVHSTQQTGSIGAEAHSHFASLGVRSSIVLGKDAFRIRTGSDRGYSAQFQWGLEPEVKIVSHAHLPLMYDRHEAWQACSQSAELLVIDELPLGALIRSVDFDCDLLRALPAGGGRIGQALLGQLHRRTQTPVPDDLTGIPVALNQPGHLKYRDSGQAFLTRLPPFTEDDWSVFARALGNVGKSKQDSRGIPMELATFLKADIEAAQLTGTDSARFGVNWTVDGGQLRQRPVFNGNVLTSLRNLPPTLVLDAYAVDPIYRGIFPDSDVVHDKQGDWKPLQVECHEGLLIDPLNIRRVSPQKPLQIAEEILLLHRQQPVTVLASSETFQPEGPWERSLYEGARGLRHDPTDLPQRLYYHSGRGINSHKGRTLVSLMPPVLPRSHQEEALSALFPCAPEQREAAHHALLEAELLQMLHRVRPHVQDSTARIITAYKPRIAPELCEVRPYRPQLTFRAYAEYHRWLDAVTVLAEELHDLFGGVPKSLLAALGLLTLDSNSTDSNSTTSVMRHGAVLRRVLQQTSPKPGSELHSWLSTGKLHRFDAVPTYRKRSAKLLNDHMSELGFQAGDRLLKVSVDGEILQSKMYVRPGQDPEEVFRRIYCSDAR